MKILDIIRLNNSKYGNPRYHIIGKDYKGNIISGKTLSDSSLGYACGSHWKGKHVKLDYHKTKKGNIIFDRIKRRKKR